MRNYLLVGGLLLCSGLVGCTHLNRDREARRHDGSWSSPGNRGSIFTGSSNPDLNRPVPVTPYAGWDAKTASVPVMPPSTPPAPASVSGPQLAATKVGAEPVAPTIKAPAEPVAPPPVPTVRALPPPPPAEPTVARSASTIVRRSHLRFSEEKTAQEFLRAAAKKQLLVEEVRVLDRLLNEKAEDLSQFNQLLEERFGVTPTGNYQYDAASRTIFELQPKPAAKAGEKTADKGEPFAKREHRKLADQKSEQQFAQLVAAKKVTFEEVRALQLLVRERRAAVEAQEQQLKAEYSITKDRNYQYDAEKMELFELIPMPTGKGLEAGTETK